MKESILLLSNLEQRESLGNFFQTTYILNIFLLTVNSLFLSWSLISHSSHLFLNFFLITQVVMTKRLQIFVEFVNERYTGWNVHLKDFSRLWNYSTIFWHIIKILDDGSDWITMSYDNHSFMVKNILCNVIMPEGNDSSNCIFQTLCEWKSILRNALVSSIIDWISRITNCKSWRRDIIRSFRYFWLCTFSRF